ncbi:MAG: 2Fe-2S iron-sulfur cluster-binding protein [bacterium]
MQITIDHIPIEVQEGMTVMQAAESAGIRIPALCYLPGHSSHPSCMVCMVKDLTSGKMIPSCAVPAEDGMNLSAHGEEVMEARKEALELLLSDHVGDCEAPCRLSCPAFMNIPLMNRLIAAGRMEEALQVVRQEIALPLVLGTICPAPCENACPRKKVDEPVSICLLKRFTAQDDNIRNSGLHTGAVNTGKRAAVIGTGSAGLSAAFYLLRMGHACVLFDKQELPGGALRSAIPDDLLPKKMLDADIECIRKMGGEFILNTPVTRQFWTEKILPGYDAVILATGFREEHPIDGFGLEPGVFRCGSVVSKQLLSVRSVAQGKRAALEADAYLLGKTDIRRTSLFNSAIGPMKEPELEEYMKESIPGGRTHPTEGYLAGFSPEEAIQEAKRCMHCDCRKQSSCKLRNYADEYGVNRKRFAARERNLLTRNLQHVRVVYVPENCIRCGLCVEITQRESETLGLAFVGRGFDVRIHVPFNRTMQEGLAKTAHACIDACPTGALAYKDSEMVK